MARADHELRTSLFAWSTHPVPLLTVMSDINGKWLESAVRTQKDWTDFIHRRVQEDISASQQLMSCRSLTEMQQVYARYWRTAFDQLREQSERVLQSGKSVTEELAQTMKQRVEEATQRTQH